MITRILMIGLGFAALVALGVVVLLEVTLPGDNSDKTPQLSFYDTCMNAYLERPDSEFTAECLFQLQQNPQTRVSTYSDGTTCGGNMFPVGIREIPAGCIVIGRRIWTRNPDSFWSTDRRGDIEVITLTHDTWVYLPYRGTSRIDSLDSVREELQKSGCFTGCKDINEITQ